MKRAFIIVFIFTVMLGTIGVALNLSMGNETAVYLTRIRIETGQFLYKFDFQKYIMNMNMAITDTSTLTLQLPSRAWQQMGGIDFGIELGNNLALFLDYILFGINILLYPFRIGAYLTRAILSIVGINMNTNAEYNGLAWLVNLLNWLVERIAIPYI